MESKKKLRRGYSLKNSIALLFVVISISCLLVMLLTVLRLPEVSQEDKRMGLYRIFNIRKMTKGDIKLGKLGEMMVEMLPVDLAFTVFVPSEKAFHRDLKLWFNESSGGTEENDNTYATLSRILGFSVVPQHLRSVDVPVGKENVLDSISGFKLYVTRGFEGSIVVNRIRSKVVDLKKGEIVIHIMDGVIMDGEFEQSFQSDYEAEN